TGVEEAARPRTSADEEAREHALASERDDEVRLECIELRETLRRREQRARDELLADQGLRQRREEGAELSVGVKPERGSAATRRLAGGLGEAVGAAEEDGDPAEPERRRRHGQRQPQDLVEAQRRAERLARGREHRRGIVRPPAEDHVDEPLHPVAELREKQEYGDRERERERGRLPGAEEVQDVGRDGRQAEIRGADE